MSFWFSNVAEVLRQQLAEQLAHLLGLLLQRFRLERDLDRLIGDLPVQLQRLLYGDPQEPEGFVRQDLYLLALLELAVQACDRIDLLGRDLLSLLSERLTQLYEEVAGVEELHLAASFRSLAVSNDPEIGRNPGVVEELVG